MCVFVCQPGWPTRAVCTQRRRQVRRKFLGLNGWRNFVASRIPSAVTVCRFERDSGKGERGGRYRYTHIHIFFSNLSRTFADGHGMVIVCVCVDEEAIFVEGDNNNDSLKLMTEEKTYLEILFLIWTRITFVVA